MRTEETHSQQEPTIWGLSPVEVHDRFWAARGIQIVRTGGREEVSPDAELFLLTGWDWLFLFKLEKVVKALSWGRPRLLYVRVRDERDRGYWEKAILGEDNAFLGFQRRYGIEDRAFTRVLITPEKALADRFQNAPDVREGWKQLRRQVGRSRRLTIRVAGEAFDARVAGERVQILKDLTAIWHHPNATISNLVRTNGSVWMEPGVQMGPTVRCVGPVWIGSGRSLPPGASVVGPTILWDAPEARREQHSVAWSRLRPTATRDGPLPKTGLAKAGRLHNFGKRAFDVVSSLLALAVTLPIYPVILFLIWKEDGRPFFFTHRRETLGGRQFPCIKFRSMRKDAEDIKRELQAQNQADGPQWNVKDDPRVLRIGHFIRKTKIDELPQFVNVLLGHMSLVGPRPSPYEENQFCPAWREARLSVRPGITGLWQVKRTRAEGQDFQEWIRYDIEYVENLSWRLDLWIIWRTVFVMFRGD